MSCQFHHPSLVNCRHCVFWWVAAHVFVSVAGCPPPLACDAFHWSRDQHSCIVAYEPTSVKDKVTCIMIRYIFAACSTFHGIIIIINKKMEIEYGSGHAFFDWMGMCGCASLLEPQFSVITHYMKLGSVAINKEKYFEANYWRSIITDRSFEQFWNYMHFHTFIWEFVCRNTMNFVDDTSKCIIVGHIWF